MTKAILYDAFRCIGCRACQVACKRWNELEAEEKTSLRETWTNPPDLSSRTWNLIRMVELSERGEVRMHFFTYRCMHCLEPICVKVCPPRAMVKDPKTGAVVTYSERCVGCLLCVEYCPFRAPRFERGPGTRKCRLCIDRLEMGLKPACVQACSAEALEFGERDEIVRRARKRAAQAGGYIYGLEEAGGTQVIMVLTAPPEVLGSPRVEKKVYEPSLEATVRRAAIETGLSGNLLSSGGIGMGAAALLAAGATVALISRRSRARRKEGS